MDALAWFQLGMAALEGAERIYRLALAANGGRPITADDLAAARGRTDGALAGLEAAVTRRTKPKETGKENPPDGPETNPD